MPPWELKGFSDGMAIPNMVPKSERDIISCGVEIFNANGQVNTFRKRVVVAARQ
jgi:hypothetical protein